ncbi:MAG: BNR repeat-containing protein, partial [Luteolibacter sp.]
ASCPADAVSDGILIDRVWAGHPVNFGLLTERDHQFIAYYDSERRLTVKGRKLHSTDWTSVQPGGIEVARRNRMSNVTGWDSHNYLTLALDRDGCLHLSGNMHADPLVYYRTTRPFDLTTLKRIDHMTGENEKTTTYPNFFTNDAGDLLFRYRDGGSGNGSDFYNVYDSEKQEWKRLFEGPLLDGEGERSAYSSGPQRGPDGLFHLIWMWRETPDAMTNHTLSYARSSDLIHWETSSGKPLTRPIQLTHADVIDPAKPGDGLINSAHTLGFDHEKHPVALYHRFDNVGKSQAFVARPDQQGHWVSKQISDWNFRWDFSGRGSQGRQITLGAPSLADDGNLTASFSTNAAGSGQWLLDGTSLELIDILPASDFALPKALETPTGTFPGLGVRTRVSQGDKDRWVLRWETLGPNRDLEYREAPPPSELRLYQFPGGKAGQDSYPVNDPKIQSN